MNSQKNMLFTRNRFLQAMLLSLAFAAPASAQQPFPFQMQYTQGPITTTLQNGGLLTLVAPVGQSQTLQIRAVYTGTGVVTLTQQPSLAGSSAFTATINQSLPAVLNPGQTLFFSVRFGPFAAETDSARLAISFSEVPASTVEPITLSLQGLTSAVVPSYTTPDNNNIVPLSPGDTIVFPETPVGTTSPISLNFTNIGSALAQVTRVTSSGSAFVLQNLPLFPASLAGGQSVSMRITYRPTATGPSTGTLTLEIAGAEPMTINLRGSATAPKLTYQSGTPPVTLTPGGTLSLPGSEIGQSSTVLVQVTNTGTASTTVNTISTVGAGFTFTNNQTLPQTLAPNASFAFTVTFTPTRSGTQSGTLAVNSDVFNLSGSGLGSLLTFSYVSGGTTITLGTGNNSVIFSPVRITQSGQLNLDIKNTGTTATSIQNIGIGQANSAFSVTNTLALPASLAPDATLRVNLKFEPTVTGFVSGTLIVDNTSITLTGSGTAPPALPSYTISGPSGTVAPLTQPNVGLKLAAPYPVALTGVLTLVPSVGNLPADPAVQFATGGRTIAFRIPANTTDAIFGAQGTQLGLQTGTVAGTFTITPSFATQAGNVDLTPVTPVAAQFSVGNAGPVLVSVQVLNPTATGFTIQATGFATTRSLTAINIQFASAPGFQLPTTQFTVDLKSIAAAWFQNTASQAFGGQFRVSIPFTFRVSDTPLAVGQTIADGISSVSVSVANESGTSTVLKVGQ